MIYLIIFQAIQKKKANGWSKIVWVNSSMLYIRQQKQLKRISSSNQISPSSKQCIRKKKRRCISTSKILKSCFFKSMFSPANWKYYRYIHSFHSITPSFYAIQTLMFPPLHQFLPRTFVIPHQLQLTPPYPRLPSTGRLPCTMRR